MKIKALAVLGIICSALMAGCFTPQFMPAARVQARVIDAKSKKPIVGAELFMIYRGASGQTVKHGPFVTDSNGQGTIVVEKQMLWPPGLEAGFVGGYLREIEVLAPAYESSGFHEGFDRNQIEAKAPLVFELEPFRNRFGSVVVVAQEEGKEAHKLQVLVQDGPHAKERVTLSVFSIRRNIDSLVGKKFYLRTSLEEIRQEERQRGVTAHNFDGILREGLPSEPFNPEIKSTEGTPGSPLILDKIFR